jgi:AraC family transcriptional regulator of adaptative response/methylated-DNA-[protein]-cysteine methyltransferase
MIHEKSSPKTLISSHITTPLGTMIAVADENALYLLEFIDRKHFDRKMKQFITKINAHIVPGTNAVLKLITEELAAYFAGNLKSFTTPLCALGSPFQQTAWNFLQTVPYGQTRTYAQEAIMIGNKKASRAVAHANSNNTLAIIIPCHRIIASSGKLCGYAGGLDRKQWLINHEQQNFRSI